ncbi:TetR/AcrR family transcriptional regulator [Woodsholea maritima]|uniref:TetR/AcrR family transcriptional regulator n=1 Tax=Woodsholea maritima TaxID=240237 RepID=UPI000367AD55|nr:TetR/AcrR family transcriptional regulator [Woodsholea maritima]
MARPLTFDRDAALDAIKQTFWARGYEATSMQDIEGATGLKKQSLYRLYGDKQGMYRAALMHYESHEVAAAEAFLRQGAGTGAGRITQVFTSVVDTALTTQDRRGCFLCNASVDVALLDQDSRTQVRMMMERVRQAFLGALIADQGGASEALEGAADGLLALYNGLRVLIKAESAETVLRHVVQQAGILVARAR